MENNTKFAFLLSAALMIAPFGVAFAEQSSNAQIENLKNNSEFYEVDPETISIEYFGELADPQPVKGVNEPVDINPVKRDAISDAGSLIDVLDKIVNVAKKVWDIIDESKPVADISTMYATALPYSKTAAQLSGWSSPKGYRYGFYAKNLYGIKTVNVTYKVTFQYGGRYNGRGRYLTAVTVVPENVETLIGYSFYMKAYVPDSTIVNIGTAENPIAALRLVVQWKISTIISSYQSTAVYYITGDGKFRQISGSLAVAYKDFPTPAEDLKYRDITPNYVMPTPVVPITNPGKDSALPKNSIPAKLKRNMDNIFGK